MDVNEPIEPTKRCPFCAEKILQAAIKCRYCGEFLTPAPPPVPVLLGTGTQSKWYFSTSTVVVGLLCLGPIALPLVWINPRYKPITKVVVTIIVVLATAFLCYLMTYLYAQLIEQIKDLGM